MILNSLCERWNFLSVIGTIHVFFLALIADFQSNP